MKREIAAILAVVIPILGILGLYWYQEEVRIPAQYGEDAVVYNLTGLQSGMWTLDTVAGYNYWWKDYERVVELTARVGDPVVFRVTSADVYHSFAIPELDLFAGEVQPGMVEELKVVADTTGAYTFRCYLFCSPAHPAMFGRFRVTN